MIKRIEPKDYAYVLKLNEEYVDVLIPMDRDELSFLEKRAAIFHIIYVPGVPAASSAFILCQYNRRFTF